MTSSHIKPTLEGTCGGAVAYTISPQTISTFIFDGVGELLPQPDITPLESLHISIMLAVSQTRWGYWDYAEYSMRHGLERHFKS